MTEQSCGNVIPREDGRRAKCGGPNLCGLCKAEIQELCTSASTEPNYQLALKAALKAHPWLQVLIDERDNSPEPEFAVATMQLQLSVWAQRNFGKQLAHHMLLGALEELGELSHAHLKAEHGIRGTAEEHAANAKDAVGDVVMYLSQYCSARSWSLEEILQTTLATVLKRDWVKDPEKGGRSDL